MDKLTMNKLLALSGFLSFGIAGQTEALASDKQLNTKPNVIVIFADDLGYGDLGVYGHPTIQTPNLDQMASEGQKWTNFYCSSSVCTPSRAGLLTGRLPVRNGMCSDTRRVLFPDSKGGLPQSEITIAKSLKKKEYQTAAIGKWHLGHLPEFQPLSHGFDYYFGIPYSNDMDRLEGLNAYDICTNPKTEYFNVPLMRNKEIIERPADQNTITKRYTEEAINFISKNKKNPFFLYLAHSMPHVPLFASKDFKGTSKRGLYGDVVQELDWSVGQILKTLKETELDKNTLVVFTSDNGPWLYFKEAGGSAGLLREGKGTSYEGGMREPAIFWWPGRIKPGVITEIGSTLDLFATINKLAQVEMPSDRLYDSYDLTPTLFEKKASPRNIVFYYEGTRIFAVREGAFKIHYYTHENIYTSNQKIIKHDPPMIFNLETDPSEKFNMADQHPELVDRFDQIIKTHLKTIVPVENQLNKIIGDSKVGYEKKSF